MSIVVSKDIRRGWYKNLVDGVRNLAANGCVESVRRFVHFAIAQANSGTNSQKAELLFHLGSVEFQNGAAEQAINYVEKGLKLDPDNAFIGINVAIFYVNICFFERAIEITRSLLKSKEHGARAWQMLHYLSHVQFAVDPASCRRVETEYGRYLSQCGLTPRADRPLEPIGERKIRIGYVYGRWHYLVPHCLIEKLIASHDRSQFEIFCYTSTYMTRKLSDELTKQPASWVNLVGLNAQDALERVLDNKLDILVDLDGTSMMASVGLYRKRPAPIMVSWFGAIGGFGGLFDYLIADRLVLPETERARYDEKILYLPHSYIAFTDQGGVSSSPDLPCLKQGGVTFASCDDPTKIHQAAVDCWARIVKAVKGSRLILSHGVYSNDFWRKRALGFLEKSGLSCDRYQVTPFRLEGAVTSEEAPAFGFSDIDIVLDTFPFSASSTNFEALRHSVPVVTWQGEEWRSRIGASMLKTVGLDELIAHSMEEYEALAVSLAQDEPRLTKLRSAICKALLLSPLVDVESLTSDLEELFHRMIAERSAQA